ncbi:MAG TPA: hypothetical protein DIV44_00760 [Leeuwenhoekiella sp.]|nr:hypothetical protein [Leeuwenhoekiella sp.]HCQ75315.1 hypothetical protein [Leeuwenhoekiella sp.]|tara:strand:- start:1256 stop:2284 length:1029 start_codon:yes stop_codon:yes gene_type:complete
MKNKLKKIWKLFIRAIPLILTIIVFVVLFWTLTCNLGHTENFSELLAENRTDILTISGLISGLIIAYLTAKVLQIRQEKIARFPELSDYTQKLHKCRSVIDKLIHSRLWPDGVRYLVDTKYKGLTHFEYREIEFVDSKPTKRATEFVNDENFSSLACLYLELKSFKFDQYPFDQTLYTEFDVPLYYNSSIVQKWIDYDCGNGLWYYFDHKYAVYKDSLNLKDIYVGYKEEMKDNCLRIDQARYKDLEFGPELLSKLGTHIHADILPKLIRIQRYMDSDLPKIIKYLFAIAGLLIVFGISLPLLNNIYTLSPFLDLVSISVVISTSFYLIISFYGFMKREIKV